MVSNYDVHGPLAVIMSLQICSMSPLGCFLEHQLVWVSMSEREWCLRLLEIWSVADYSLDFCTDIYT